MSEKLNENLITYTRDTLLFTVKSICNMLSNARWTVFDTDGYFKNQEGYEDWMISFVDIALKYFQMKAIS